MKKTGSADSNLDSVTSKLDALRKESGHKSGSSFSQAGIFDEIDKTGSITSQIESSGVADIAITDAMSTLTEVGDQLNNPDITPSERKALKPYIEIARKQLEVSSGEGLSESKKKDYDKAKNQISERLDKFEQIIKKGTGKGLASQMGGALAGKAGGFLVGILTQNPMMSMAFDAVAGHISKKKENRATAEKKLSDTRRAQITQLEGEKSSFKSGGESKVSAEKPSIESLAQQSFDEQEGVTTPEPRSTQSQSTSKVTATKGGEERPTLESQNVLHEDLQELIKVNESMVEVLKEIEEDGDKTRVLAEKAEVFADENRLEAGRKKGGMLGKGKKKLKDVKEGILGMFADIADVFVGMRAFAMSAIPIIITAAKAMKGIFKIFTKLFAIPLAIFGGIYEAITSWADSEGKAMPERILNTIIDFAAGAFNALTFGLVGADTFKGLFKDFGKKLYEFWDGIMTWAMDQLYDLIPDFIKDSKVEKQAESDVGSAKKAFSQDFIGNEIRIKDEAEMKKVDFPTLRSIMQSPLAVPDTKEKIRKYLIEKNELVARRKSSVAQPIAVDEAGNNMSSPTQNVSRTDGSINEIATRTSDDRVAQSVQEQTSDVTVNNVTTNNTSQSMISKGVPVTTSQDSSARGSNLVYA